jgi:hypothetical protein
VRKGACTKIQRQSDLTALPGLRIPIEHLAMNGESIVSRFLSKYQFGNILLSGDLLSSAWKGTANHYRSHEHHVDAGRAVQPERQRLVGYREFHTLSLAW